MEARASRAIIVIDLTVAVASQCVPAPEDQSPRASRAMWQTWRGVEESMSYYRRQRSRSADEAEHESANVEHVLRRLQQPIRRAEIFGKSTPEVKSRYLRETAASKSSKLGAAKIFHAEVYRSPEVLNKDPSENVSYYERLKTKHAGEGEAVAFRYDDGSSVKNTASRGEYEAVAGSWQNVLEKGLVLPEWTPVTTEEIEEEIDRQSPLLGLEEKGINNALLEKTYSQAHLFTGSDIVLPNTFPPNPSVPLLLETYLVRLVDRRGNGPSMRLGILVVEEKWVRVIETNSGDVEFEAGRLKGDEIRVYANNNSEILKLEISKNRPKFPWGIYTSGARAENTTTTCSFQPWFEKNDRSRILHKLLHWQHPNVAIPWYTGVKEGSHTVVYFSGAPVVLQRNGRRVVHRVGELRPNAFAACPANFKTCVAMQERPVVDVRTYMYEQVIEMTVVRDTPNDAVIIIVMVDGCQLNWSFSNEDAEAAIGLLRGHIAYSVVVRTERHSTDDKDEGFQRFASRVAVRRSPMRTLRPRVIGSPTHSTAGPSVDGLDVRVAADTSGKSVAFRDKDRLSQAGSLSDKVKDISTKQSVVHEDPGSQTSTDTSTDQSPVQLLVEEPTAAPDPPKRWVRKKSTDGAMPLTAPALPDRGTQNKTFFRSDELLTGPKVPAEKRPMNGPVVSVEPRLDAGKLEDSVVRHTPAQESPKNISPRQTNKIFPKKSRASIKFESHFQKVGFDESNR